MLLHVAVQSKALVCSRMITVIAGLNPAEGKDVCLMCLLHCVGGDLCNGLFTHSEESY